MFPSLLKSYLLQNLSSAWVTRLECPKGVKDEVKQARRAKRVAEGHQLEIGAQRAPRFLVGYIWFRAWIQRDSKCGQVCCTLRNGSSVHNGRAIQDSSGKWFGWKILLVSCGFCRHRSFGVIFWDACLGRQREEARDDVPGTFCGPKVERYVIYV